MEESFRSFAHRASEIAGSPWAFIAAVGGVVIWALLGPVFDFADSWLITMATVSSIIPSLMVFLIQNTQNRDTKAMQLKLDELIRATGQARNRLIHLESMSDAELHTLEKEFQRVRSSRQLAGDGPDQAADTTRSTSSP